MPGMPELISYEAYIVSWVSGMDFITKQSRVYIV